MTKHSPLPTEKAKDLFRLGWRMVERVGADGVEYQEQVPLTEWDVLHPQEDDFIVQNEAHTRNCIYLRQALEAALADRDDVKVLFDHRVDWQVPGVLPHGPDVVVLAGVRKPWDPWVGTFPVRDMGAEVLLVIEVVSQSTWKNDYNTKVFEYHRAGIPYYIIVDHHDSEEGAIEMLILGHVATPQGFVHLPTDPEKGVWIPTVQVWFKSEGDRIACVDACGIAIPERADLDRQIRESLAREKEAQKLAEKEKARAEKETKRAAKQKARADAAEARIRELEAELKKKKKP